MGDCYQQFYFSLLKVQQAMSSLENVVFYMNLPVDVGTRMRRARALAAQGRDKYQEICSWYSGRLADSTHRATKALGVLPDVAEEISAKSPRSISIMENELKNHNHNRPKSEWQIPFYAADLICMYGRNATFTYPKTGSTYVLEESDFTLSQGKLMAVTGARGGGKATFLNLLSGLLVPGSTDQHTGEKRHDGGTLFIPPHCRVLHVGFEALLIPEFNLYENLCFGPSDGEDESRDRVLNICRRLGMSEAVLKTLEEDAMSEGQSVQNEEIASAQQSVEDDGEDGLQGTVESMVARQSMEDVRAKEKLLSLTDKCLIHIARALVMNPELHWSRRPRTCVFSLSSTGGVEVVDTMLHIGGGKVEVIDISGMYLIKKVTRHLFADLDESGDHQVTSSDFCKNSASAKWSKELLGIDSTTTREQRLAVYCSIMGSESALMDLDSLFRYLRAANNENKIDVTPEMVTNRIADADEPQEEEEISLWDESVTWLDVPRFIDAGAAQKQNAGASVAAASTDWNSKHLEGRPPSAWSSSRAAASLSPTGGTLIAAGVGTEDLCSRALSRHAARLATKQGVMQPASCNLFC